MASHIKPNIAWLRDDAKAVVVKDNTWGAVFKHQSHDGSVISVKAGNKLYVLSGNTQSEVVKDRSITSEAALFKKYRYDIENF